MTCDNKTSASWLGVTGAATVPGTSVAAQSSRKERKGVTRMKQPREGAAFPQVIRFTFVIL